MAIQLAPYFSDPDGDALTYSAAGLPSGLSLDPITGIITGAPAAAGNFNTTIIATDPGGRTAEDTFVFTIAPSDFQLVVVNYVDPAPNAQVEAAIEAARVYWNHVLPAPLPAELYNGDPAFQQIAVDVVFESIDGAGGRAAEAAVTNWRSGSMLTLEGYIRFDPDDTATALTYGWFDELCVHEFAHVLGIGFTSRNIISGPLVVNDLYIGAAALAEYSTLTGQSETGIPVEDCQYCSGDHWSESVFGNELMSPTINTSNDPISRMSLAVLEDLGYSPNYAMADPYSLP